MKQIKQLNLEEGFSGKEHPYIDLNQLENSAKEDIQQINQALMSEEIQPKLKEKYGLLFCSDDDPKDNIGDWKDHLKSIKSYIKWKYEIKE